MIMMFIIIIDNCTSTKKFMIFVMNLARSMKDEFGFVLCFIVFTIH